MNLKLDLHELLVEKREASWDGPGKLTQPAIGKLIDRSQSQVSKIERGEVAFHSMRGVDLYDLLVAYRFTVPEIHTIAAHYRLTNLSTYLAKRERTFSVKEGPQVRFLGKVNAGMLTTNVVDSEMEFRFVPTEIAERYDLDDVYAVEVDGDSMVSEDARETIPPGSLVFFHSKLTPVAGDIICAYLKDSDHTVIKRYHPRSTFAVLRSSNQSHEPIILRDSDAGVMQGVYLAHTTYSHRLK